MLLFAIFSSSEFLFVAILEYRPSRIVKMAFSGPLQSPILISRKIFVVEKYCNFHIMYSQFPNWAAQVCKSILQIGSYILLLQQTTSLGNK